MAIDIAGRLEEALAGVRSNIGTQTGTVRYVREANSHDNNDGLSKDRPFHTINAAILASSAGDTIHVAHGTYDEAVDIIAGHTGLKVICEPGVYIVNTTPGTAVQINSAQVYWEGGVIEINGQVGMQVNDDWFVGKNIQAYNCTIGFDMNAEFPVLINCRTNLTSSAGFDIAEDSGWYIDCHCQGAAASRGFYLSHTNAEDNMFIGCSTNGCTAGGYETVAGADQNCFVLCVQSILCAGPTDGGASNTWASHSKDSVISPGNTLQDDLNAIHALVGTIASGGGASYLYSNITSAANAGDVTIGTVASQACMLQSIVVRANDTQTTDLTGITVKAGASEVITLIDAVTGIRGNIAVEDQQIAWIGKVELPVGGTIVMTLSGSGATAVDLQVTIEYTPIVSGGSIS